MVEQAKSKIQLQETDETAYIVAGGAPSLAEEASATQAAPATPEPEASTEDATLVQLDDEPEDEANLLLEQWLMPDTSS